MEHSLNEGRIRARGGGRHAQPWELPLQPTDGIRAQEARAEVSFERLLLVLVEAAHRVTGPLPSEVGMSVHPPHCARTVPDMTARPWMVHP